MVCLQDFRAMVTSRDIHWRDNFICPTEEQDRSMVIDSMIPRLLIFHFLFVRNRWIVSVGVETDANFE
jgi:hypothetical protein